MKIKTLRRKRRRFVPDLTLTPEMLKKLTPPKPQSKSQHTDKKQETITKKKANIDFILKSSTFHGRLRLIDQVLSPTVKGKVFVRNAFENENKNNEDTIVLTDLLDTIYRPDSQDRVYIETSHKRSPQTGVWFTNDLYQRPSRRTNSIRYNTSKFNKLREDNNKLNQPTEHDIVIYMVVKVLTPNQIKKMQSYKLTMEEIIKSYSLS